MKIEQLLTLKDAAKLLRCSVMTIRRRIEQGKRTDGEEGIWPIYHAAGIRIPPRALERYLESVKAKATT